MKNLKYLNYKEVANFLTCPKCFTPLKSTLLYKGKHFVCNKCKYKYPIKNKIIQLINPGILSKQVKKESVGNIIPLTKKNIARFAKKDEWSDYYNHFVNQKISYLMKDYEKTNLDKIVSLGSGPGFEIKEILKKKDLSLVFSSDLAATATRIVPHTLKKYKTTLCLFTSDLNFVPVLRNKGLPILIYEALHHTSSSHRTLERMLEKGYKNIFFVEPCTNFLIKIMAKLGLAQREEYSGLIPDFINIGRVRKLAQKYKYHLNINTIWEVPEDFFRVVCKKGSLMEPLLLKLIDLLSTAGNLFSFGSFSIVHLYKKDAK